MIPSAGTLDSRMMTLADFRPMPFKAVKPSMVSGMLSSFWIVCAISISQLALVAKFLTSEIKGVNVSRFALANFSILGNFSNNAGEMELIWASES